MLIAIHRLSLHRRGLGAAVGCLVMGCGSSASDGGGGGVAHAAGICVDGRYAGPEPGVSLPAGSRDDECLEPMPGEDESAALTEVTGNGCSWRITLVGSGDVLEEGECTVAVAEESAATWLFLATPASNTLESDFRGGLVADTAWCGLTAGLSISESEVRPAQNTFELYAMYSNAEGAEFWCQRDQAGPIEWTQQASIDIDTIAPVCWHDVSYYYEVHGTAEFVCGGKFAGDTSGAIVASIEVDF